MTKYELRLWHADPIAADIAELIHERLDYGQEVFGPFTDTKDETDILEEVLDTAIYAARRLVELKQKRTEPAVTRCDTCQSNVFWDTPMEAGP